MKVDFNGLRRNIAIAFNRVADTQAPTEELAELRQHLAFLLLVYDEEEWVELDPSDYLREIQLEGYEECS